jgi:outer membrane protein
MKLIAIILIAFILVSPAILNAEEIALTLDEAIVIALRDNRDVLLKAEEVKKAKEKIAEAKAGLLPTLDFTGSRTLTRGLYSKDIAQTATQTTLKQYIYKGGETINTIKENEDKLEVSQAIIDLKATQLSKEKAIKDIALELKNAYLDLKNAVAKMKSANAEIDSYKDAFSVIQDKYNAGIASFLDLNDASLGYAVSLFNQKQAIYDYILAQAHFDKATGGERMTYSGANFGHNLGYEYDSILSPTHYFLWQ